MHICNSINLTDAEKTLGIHLRLGDWHKSINESNLKTILSNIKNWLLKHPIYEKLLIIYCSKRQHETFVYNDCLLRSQDSDYHI